MPVGGGVLFVGGTHAVPACANPQDTLGCPCLALPRTQCGLTSIAFDLFCPIVLVMTPLAVLHSTALILIGAVAEHLKIFKEQKNRRFFVRSEKSNHV